MDITLSRADLTALPGPGQTRLAVRITPVAERNVRAGHPWIFDGAIRSMNRDGAPGDLAVIFDRKDRFLAVGLYDPLSPIRVRVLAHGRPQIINPGWFHARLRDAAALRAGLFAPDPAPSADNATDLRVTDGYRIVHGENDGLPGLVVDRYAGVLVIKLYSAAWIPHLMTILDGLAAVQPATAVLLRLSRALQAAPDHLHGLANGMLLHGRLDELPVIFRENGLRFAVDPIQGQKTGFFLDQRENRLRVEHLAAGRRVLNVFAYSGGFSLYAARGGAPAVTSLDSSEPALRDAQVNFALNQDIPTVAAATHITLAADAFAALPALAAEGRRFDMVILDPPAFAKRQEEVPRALAAYGRMVDAGLRLLAEGGILVAASCSARVSAQDFFAAVHRAAHQAGRPLAELERTQHAADHPIAFPEGAYLKCLFATVS